MHKLSVKIISVVGLIFVLMIPLMMILAMVSERQNYRQLATHSIASSWTGPQRFTGPVLAIPYTETVIVTAIDPESKKQTNHAKKVEQVFYLQPDLFELKGKIETEYRYRGIYRIPVFQSSLTAVGEFKIPKRLGLSEKKDIQIGTKPFLILGIQDNRGITSAPGVTWNQKLIEFNPGSNSSRFDSGVHAALPTIVADAEMTFTYSFDLNLQGMQSFAISPIGKENRFSLDSPWQHPSFVGDFSPTSRSISDQGFSAQWAISHFATNYAEVFQLDNETKISELCNQSVGVSLIEPVDVYLKSERSVKYGGLFVGLTFIAFLLFEIFKALRIHIIQYGMVGFALAIFYLLLLSLSEHIPFLSAYLVASAACLTILTIYLASILRSWIMGFGFGVALGGMYLLLYILLQAEDYGLLMGALLLFTALAIIMLITRKVDWFDLSERFKNDPPPTSELTSS